jgi:hypothetical protein
MNSGVITSKIEYEPDLSISQSDNDVDNGMLFIKYLPKDKLLYNLWMNAKQAQYMYFCPELSPKLTMMTVRQDINYMIHNKRELDLTTYYGRLLFIDISGDYVDVFTYNLYNGNCKVESIINELKIEELGRSIVKYYTFF